MGFFSTLYAALFKSNYLDTDLTQRELVHQLIAAADQGIFQQIAVKTFVHKNRWSQSEMELRIAHAIGIVQVIRPDVYEQVFEIALKQTAR